MQASLMVKMLIFQNKNKEKYLKFSEKPSWERCLLLAQQSCRIHLTEFLICFHSFWTNPQGKVNSEKQIQELWKPFDI